MDFPILDEDFYEELEETLIMGDLGVHTTMEIIEDLREKVKDTAYQRTDRVPAAFDRQYQRADGRGRDGI